ncbi:MAG: DUF739 family protein [Erysipelotrichaceae bacterium]|nr:DUF739 family protein [Erysipelotrichaceae bacterium]
MTNSLKLKARIIEKGYTMTSLAKLIGISFQSMSYKVNNKREFNQTEIASICVALDINDYERSAYFFV